jgi:membrane protein implicated in regulation of membrane protease activity
MDFYIYLICFGVGLLFALISAFLADVFGGHEAPGHVGHPGGGADGHAEAGFGTHDMPGFSALSPTTIGAFVTAFGGFGMVFCKVDATSAPWISAPLSAVGGLAIAAVVLALFRSVFRKTQASSESRVVQLVGLAASIISPIPENGVGEIAYVDRGTRYTAPARTESGASVPAGATVRITRVVGSQFYVQPA